MEAANERGDDVEHVGGGSMVGLTETAGGGRDRIWKGERAGNRRTEGNGIRPGEWMTLECRGVVWGGKGTGESGGVGGSG